MLTLTSAAQCAFDTYSQLLVHNVGGELGVFNDACFQLSRSISEGLPDAILHPPWEPSERMLHRHMLCGNMFS